VIFDMWHLFVPFFDWETLSAVASNGTRLQQLLSRGVALLSKSWTTGMDEN